MNEWISADWRAPTNIVAGTTLRTCTVSSLPLTGDPCWLNQVHGSGVVTADHYDTPPDADGSTNGRAGSICVVRTADCLPVLMCSNDGSVFAAAHAGWRGLAAGIIENTIAKLKVDPAELMVWLGPAISQASFEVGDVVRDAFLECDSNAGTCFEFNSRGRWQADLYGLAKQRLTVAGVSEVSGGGFCTTLDSTRFYSFRCNPECGRMTSFVGLKTP